MILGKIRLINEWDMLENNKQEIANINNSLVQQANGDINNYGLGYNDVKEICRDVIRQELAIVTKEATNTLNQEISAFENQFIDRLEKLENPHVVDKLKTPKLQFVLHDTMKEFAKTDNLDTKEELVELLIERLKINEHSTEQILIDDAIKIIPKLSLAASYFLGALTQRKVTSQGYAFIVNNSLKTQAALYEHLDELTNLDIEYLKQINCCLSITGLRHYIGIIEAMKVQYDLLFRRAISREEYEDRIHSNPNIPGVKGYQIMYIDGTRNEECKLLYSSKDFLIKELEEDGKMHYLPIFEELINTIPPLNDSEIKQYLISLDRNWDKAFKILDREDIQNIDLTPIGTYIGRRIVEKVLKKKTLPLNDFYR